jgi:cysteine desulfurase
LQGKKGRHAPKTPAARQAVLKQLQRTYLDFNATAPLRPEARQACVAALDLIGNPSSIHAEGRAARAAIEAARAEVALLAGVSTRGVTFTASGTEAANLALTPHARRRGERPVERLIVSAGEHACVLKGHRFAADRVDIAPLTPDGYIDLLALEELLERHGAPVMLALQGANNETGVIHPVAAAAALVHAADGIVVCDAVQLAGRAACSMAELGADLVIVSAHKLGGPKGAGALIAAAEAIDVGAPLIRGGGQERNLRAGTENVAALAGFGAAAAAAADWPGEATRLMTLRDALAGQIRASAPDAVIFGEAAPRLPNTVYFAAPGIEASTLVMGLDLAGVAVSSGAACSSGKVTRSAVLDAMGVAGDLACGAIRLSLGWSSQPGDVERFGAVFETLVKRIRGHRAA